MEMREDRRETLLVLAPVGRVDSNSASGLEIALLARAKEPRLLIDLSSVDYISSAGLRVFLMLARKVKESGGKLALCGLGASVKQVFDLAGFTALFVVEPTVDEGAARLSP